MRLPLVALVAVLSLSPHRSGIAAGASPAADSPRAAAAPSAAVATAAAAPVVSAGRPSLAGLRHSRRLPVYADHGHRVLAAPGSCLSPVRRRAIAAELAAARARLRARGLLPVHPAPDRQPGAGAAELRVAGSLRWPVRAAAGVMDPDLHGVSAFVDHDPATPDRLADFVCGLRTYDRPGGVNHQGTDIFVWPFAWRRMDADEALVVAAASGVILAKHDGHGDRHCGATDEPWNAVYVAHADGSVAWYGHLKAGSLTPVPVGGTVTAGDVLGTVGSSGRSTGPHLHLELHAADGSLIDPFAGPCNATASASWWAEQRPYYDSAVNALRTHHAPPQWRPCPEPAVVNEARHFLPGTVVYTAAYYRDQLRDQPSVYEILRPDGTCWQHWTAALAGADFYAAAYWIWGWELPADAMAGWWTFRVTYEQVTVDWRFQVCAAAAARGPGPAAAVLHAPRPNPGNPIATVAFDLPAAGAVSLAVFDLRGRRVATLVDGWRAAGRHRVTWAGRDAAGRRAGAGVYAVRLVAGRAVRWRTLTLVP